MIIDERTVKMRILESPQLYTSDTTKSTSPTPVMRRSKRFDDDRQYRCIPRARHLHSASSTKKLATNESNT